jgi:transcription elongation factor GreA
MSEIKYLTKEKLDELKEELNDLKTRGRKDIANQIQEAREMGDLSENAEYDAAKDAQGLMEAKIAQLEDIIARSRIIDTTNMDTDKVYLMSKVKIKNLSMNNREFTYTIVSEEESDIKQNKISVKSPVGAGLVGKAVGDVADIELPNGRIIQMEVLDISFE